MVFESSLGFPMVFVVVGPAFLLSVYLLVLSVSL